MDKELQDILYPPKVLIDSPTASVVVKEKSSHEERPGRSSSSLRRTLVIGACVASSAVIGGLLVPFISPGFRRIALPFVPATDRQVSLISSVLARKTAGCTLVDLGSGDGRIVRLHA